MRLGGSNLGLFAVGAAKKEWDPRCFEAPDESKIRPLSLGIMLHDHTVV